MNQHKKQYGSTLIEVAVTVLILASSLLAMATLQSRSLQFNQGSFIRSQANIYAYDIADRIRVNRGNNGVNIVNYNVPLGTTPAGAGLVNTDLTQWYDNIKRMPDGKGSVNCVLATRVCTITIEWSEEQLFGTTAAASDLRSSFVYSTSI